ncbi:MAG TPA: serine hydrolase, partial [Isosphaeraceae bacterium]|nr:serine hydrolase [Isosphaeraceae bacterium]
MKTLRSLLPILLVPGLALAEPLPTVDPSSVGFDPDRLARVSQAVHKAVDDHIVSGAVVLVGRFGKVALVEAVGNRQVKPDARPMTRDTIFDMASLTKPVATATSVMILLERGQLRLDQRLGDLLPEFDNHGKGEITLEQLLRHRSGLIADNALSDYKDGPEAAWKNLANLDLSGTPGEKFLYSDVNFEILGRIVEQISGQTLKEFAQKNIFNPLGMTSTRFGRAPEDDPSSWPLDRTAPTAFEDGQWLTGLVHDPRARLLGGYAGHAGLFSTADDLALYAQMILNEGRGPNGRRILSPLVVRLMIDPGETPTGQRRGLGWDISTGFSSPRGNLFGPRSFGHTGFTGTSLWIDPDTQTFVILLTSRLHPDDTNRSPIALRRQVATLVASAIETPDEIPAVSPVSCGIDVLIRRDFDLLKGKRVGLITNHTGLTRDGRSTIDVLHQAPGVQLTALFSPEHGIRGQVDRKVGDSKDETTGLPIHSLYGET